MRGKSMAALNGMMIAVLCVFCLTGCAAKTGGDQGTLDGQETVSPTGGKNGTAADSGNKSGKKGSLDGIWYEQSADGSTLEVRGSEMTYHFSAFDSTTKFRKKGLGDEVDLVMTDDSFIFVDAKYIRSQDKITMHTLPHTDGDGGYHLVTFLRTPYEAPPKPVYGLRHDNTDPDAPKSFADDRIASLTLSLYEPRTDYGDMAPVPPKAGEYTYELTVRGDGNDRAGILSSNLCQDVEVPAERLEEIETLIRESHIASLNGIDVWTDEMPADEGYYHIQITYVSGEALSSRANGEDIPFPWHEMRRDIHCSLFDVLTDAGYNPSTEEFHSTAPMLRLCAPDEAPADYSVDCQSLQIDIQGTKYDYTVYSKYPVFTCTDCPELSAALQVVSRTYQEKAQKDVAETDAVMAAVPRSVWKKTEHRISYSFYVPELFAREPKTYSFVLSEGHTNCYGMEPYGAGKYSHIQFHFDSRTGKILSTADYFTDTDELADRIISILSRSFGEPYLAVFQSEKYRQELIRLLKMPENEGGVGIQTYPDNVTLTLPFGDAMRNPEYPTFTEKLYYDSCQDIIAGKYAYIW